MAIRASVTVSLVPEARGGPFVFWDDLTSACQKASALGFDGIEVFPTAPEDLDITLLDKLLKDLGLTLAAVGTGAGWLRRRLHLCLPSLAARIEARDFIRSTIDVAGAFGAPVIIGSMQGRSGEDVDLISARGHLADALEDLAGHAAGYGAPLLYEPLNRYETNLVNTVEQGVALLDSLSTANVMLLADLFHMNIEEQSIPAALRAGKSKIGHLHFVDSNRRPAGLGHIDYGPIVSALEEIGYDGFASAEALPYPDPDSAAATTLASFRRLFRRPK